MSPKERSNNKMRGPRIEKVVVNIGVGEAGEKLMRAEKVLTMICKQKPVRTISKSTNKDLGIRLGMPIGCKVTLRGKSALELLKTALWTKENRLYDYSFDEEGNFSFGVPEYTDFPGMKYDPNIGIFGMDICVTMSRRGARIKHRDRCKRRIPATHKLNPKEVKEYLAQEFKIEFIG
jgi:large subunit ribosomal protein L5